MKITSHIGIDTLVYLVKGVKNSKPINLHIQFKKVKLNLDFVFISFVNYVFSSECCIPIPWA